MSQGGAYVLKRCVACGAAYPVMNHPMAIKRSMYCEDCKRSRRADYQREYKNRGSLKAYRDKEEARRREFLASHDAVYAAAPVPVSVRKDVASGKIIETRGRCCGAVAGAKTISA